MRPLNSRQALQSKIIEDIRHSLGDFIVANLLWLLFSIPIITLPPALGALFYTTNRIVHDKPISLRTFVAGFRAYFWKSWLLMLINIVVIGVIGINALLLNQFDIRLRSIFLGFYLVLLTLWLLVQIYAFPLLLELETAQIKLAYRGSFALYFGNLPFSLLITMIILIIAGISIYAWPAWLFISGSLIAYFANIGTVYLLNKSNDPGDASE